MSRSNVINPGLVTEYGVFRSTAKRFNALLSPIQETSYKHADLGHYLVRPVIDVIAAPFFLFDAVVSAFNGVVSLVASAQLWASSVSSKKDYDDKMGRAKARWCDAKEDFYDAVSAIVAAFVNPLLSILAWITRPIASIGHAVVELCADRGNYRFR